MDGGSAEGSAPGLASASASGSASGSSVASSVTAAPGANCLGGSSSSDGCVETTTAVHEIATTPDVVTLIMEQLSVVDSLRLARTSAVWRDASREVWGTCFSLADTYVATGNFVPSTARNSAQLNALAALSIEDLVPRCARTRRHIFFLRKLRERYGNPSTPCSRREFVRQVYRKVHRRVYSEAYSGRCASLEDVPDGWYR